MKIIVDERTIPFSEVKLDEIFHPIRNPITNQIFIKISPLNGSHKKVNSINLTNGLLYNFENINVMTELLKAKLNIKITFDLETIERIFTNFYDVNPGEIFLLKNNWFIKIEGFCTESNVLNALDLIHKNIISINKSDLVQKVDAELIVEKI